MTNIAKVITGAGIALSVPSIYGIYHVFGSSGTTGDSLITQSGNKFETPKFTKHENINHGCYQNLFKSSEEGIRDEMLYGCAVMKMETDSSKEKVKFNSEVALRKGNQGWTMNVQIETASTFNYAFTELNYESGSWKSKAWKWIISNLDGYLSKRKKLIIKTPIGDWFNKEYATTNEVVQNTYSLTESTQYIGFWVESDNGNWFFRDLTISVKEENQPQIYCPDKNNLDNCFDYIKESKEANKIPDHAQNNWGMAGTGDNTNEKVNDIYKDKIIPLLKTIKDIKGTWVNQDEICSLRQQKGLNEDQKNKLIMFCSHN